MKQKSNNKKRRNITQALGDLFSLLSTAIFVLLTVLSMRNISEGSVMFYVTLAFVTAYVVLFLITFFSSVFNKDKGKEAQKDIKVAAKTVRASMKITKKVGALLGLVSAALFTAQTWAGGGLQKIFSLAALTLAIFINIFNIARKSKKITKTISKRVGAKNKIAAKSTANQCELPCADIESKEKR